jgi:hypothetical protein
MQEDDLSEGSIFADGHLRLCAIELYLEWNPMYADEEAPTFKQFMPANGSIHLLKKRNQFSSR